VWTVGALPGAGGPLDLGDAVEDLVEGGGERAVYGDRVVASDEVRLIPVAPHEVGEFVLGHARQQCRVADLVAVEVEDRQHRAVGGRVEELVAVPGGGQRTGLGLAVTDHAGDHQVRVVERRPVGVGHRVPQLAALVDRPGRLRRDVAGHAAGERELPEQPLQAPLVEADVRVDLGQRPLQPDVRHQAGAAVPGAGDVDHVDAAGGDDPVEVRVEQVQAGRGTPVPEQPPLDVLRAQRFAQQRVVQQVDLADRQVVGRAPVGVDPGQFLVGQSGLGQGAHGKSSPGGEQGRRQHSTSAR
jgi:hypothetical protein